uniref:Sigma-70 region 2 n=1 Tax=Ganoderma boninense TaxID=34458 RepID=A0A5K1K7J2_9APHY|nr:Sigma-70 region 2 [Ganoderma boninense]
MDPFFFPMPLQFHHRAATATFIVELYYWFGVHGHSANLSDPMLFPNLPVPPDHLDLDAVGDCQSIARALAHAATNKYKVAWLMEEYQTDVGRNVLLDTEREDQLMQKYPPLIEIEEFQQRKDFQLPIVAEPALFTDAEGGTLAWSLPEVIPEGRREHMLKATRLLEGQLTMKALRAEDAPSKLWRVSGPYFNRGVEWAAGTTLLSPAGFAQGHTGPKFDPAPSVDARTARASDWMREFQTSGALLDGILAVTHPALYQEALAVAEEVYRKHGACRATLSIWPSAFNSVQVISNRSTPVHRDVGGRAGWLELLLTLGRYGETGILELRTLGVSVPYSSGSVAMLCSRQVLHGVPTVPGDRVCYAWYMNKHLFKKVKADLPGKAIVASEEDHEVDGTDRDADEVDGTDRDAEGSITDEGEAAP